MNYQIRLIPFNTGKFDDFGIIHKWLNDEEILKTFGGRDKKWTMSNIRKEYASNETGAPFMILYRKKKIGFIDMFPFNKQQAMSHGLNENEKNIFCFDIVIGERQFQNRGIGQKAVLLVCQYAFQSLTASKVVLDTLAWHDQAIRCYRKCGFNTTRILKNHNLYEGKLVDNVFMELSRKQFLKTNSIHEKA